MVRISDIRFSQRCHALKMIVDPFSEEITETATGRDDGSGLPGRLVDLCGQIELGHAVILLEGSVDIGSFCGREDVTPAVGKALYSSFDQIQLVICLSLGELDVRGYVEEMIVQSSSNIDGSFDNCWSEVLVGRPYDQVVVLAELTDQMSLFLVKVGLLLSLFAGVVEL